MTYVTSIGLDSRDAHVKAETVKQRAVQRAPLINRSTDHDTRLFGVDPPFNPPLTILSEARVLPVLESNFQKSKRIVPE